MSKGKLCSCKQREDLVLTAKPTVSGGHFVSRCQLNDPSHSASSQHRGYGSQCKHTRVSATSNNNRSQCKVQLPWHAGIVCLRLLQLVDTLFIRSLLCNYVSMSVSDGIPQTTSPSCPLPPSLAKKGVDDSSSSRQTIVRKRSYSSYLPVSPQIFIYVYLERPETPPPYARIFLDGMSLSQTFHEVIGGSGRVVVAACGVE